MFKTMYLSMIDKLIKICKKQAKIYGNNQIPIKLFKQNINVIKSNFKKGLNLNIKTTNYESNKPL